MLEDYVTPPGLAREKVVLDALMTMSLSCASVLWSEEIDLDDSVPSPLTEGYLPLKYEGDGLAAPIELLTVALPLQTLHDGCVCIRTYLAGINCNVNVDRPHVSEVCVFAPESREYEMRRPSTHQHKRLSVCSQYRQQLQVH
jgi:hypothetical protein